MERFLKIPRVFIRLIAFPGGAQELAENIPRTMTTWTEADWDKPGYNPKNGKVRALFRWEGTSNGQLFHPTTGQIVPALNFTRPHSRAFHFAWFNFFMCFIMWFAIAPVMVILKKPKCAAADSDICTQCAIKFPSENMKYFGESDKDKDAPMGANDAKCKVCYPYEGRAKGRAGCGGLGLTDDQARISTLIAISGTIILRILIGAIADGIGIRTTYAILLVSTSIPGFLLSASQGYQAVYAFRFLVSFAGASFVLTQLWTTTMFDLNVVGIANATSAGWGNLGGGVAQLLNTAVYQGCKAAGRTNDLAWRTTLVWSPAVIISLGVAVFFFSDDCPYGNFRDLKKKKTEAEKAEEEAAALATGGEPGTVAAKSLIAAACSWQTWVLHACYMFSFGVELIVNGNIVTYFIETFGMPQSQAGFIGSIFGLLNIFARSWGGFWSDAYLTRWGICGRLHALFQQTFVMGVCLITFSSLTRDKSGLDGMIVNLVFWGIFTNMTEGGTFAVVPYVNPTATGGVAGIVGAGGNVGALLGNFLVVMLKGNAGPKPATMLMFCALGWGALASSLLIPCLWLPGIGSMFRAAPDSEKPAPAVVGDEKKAAAPVNPSAMPGPMPTFVPAPGMGYPQMGVPMMMGGPRPF